MTKGKIGKTEIRLLENGEFRCKDPELLRLINFLMADYDYRDHGYQPHRHWHKMTWICQQLGGKLTYFEPIDYSKIPDDVCFSAI